MYKKIYETESYVKTILNRRHRSALAKVRCGVAPIRIETGRFERLAEEERLCKICSNGEIESELHVITKCSAYDSLREDLYMSASNMNSDFNDLEDVDKMCFLLSSKDMVKMTAKTCCDILALRAQKTHSLL